MSEMLLLFARTIMAFAKDETDDEKIRFLNIEHFYKNLRGLSDNLPDPPIIIHCSWEGMEDATADLNGKYVRREGESIKPTHSIESHIEHRVLTLLCAFETGLHVRLELDYGAHGGPTCTLTIEDTSENPDVKSIIKSANEILQVGVWTCVGSDQGDRMTPSQIEKWYFPERRN
ncbi:hypothetical protein HOA73_04790 [Candidatus Peregrinibacteria bacterium]|nr:hypothetical protein [Candidatus Peregrinibacteria bacterium]MBT6731244.1 hypothetical protein [Candidatus Peregrinibacteria bacterium]